MPRGRAALAGYIACLEEAGFEIELQEWHDEALFQVLREINGKAPGGAAHGRVKKIDLPDFDFAAAAGAAKAAVAAIRERRLRYALIVAGKAG